MKTLARQSLIRLLPLALLCPTLLQAQTPPDAGQLRQQIERTLPPTLPPPPTPAPAPAPPPPPMQALAGKVLVQQFRFAGNTLVPTSALETALAPWTNRELDFSQLQEVAAAAAALYRDAGWVVRAYLPRQEIIDGVVLIQIVEASFGGVRIEAAPGVRVSSERLQKIVLASQASGQPVHAAPLDRSLLLLAELPGVRVAGSLQEGQRQGESDVVLTVANAPLFGADASIDNTGSRSTGALRLSANLALNSPMGWTDQASMNFVHTEGSDFLRAAYALPLGYGGWRMGINASIMFYRLVSADFESLDADGDSSSTGVEFLYPLLRSRTWNVNLQSSADRKHFNNTSGGATTTRYTMWVSSWGLSGSRSDQHGISNGSVSLSSGWVDLNGSPNEAADAATTRTAGSFVKLRLAVSRTQLIAARWSAFALLSGQLASKNMDSGEKFYLGGAGGVRAYPASEAGGSEGGMLNLELRFKVIASVQLAALYDAGIVRVNRNNDFTGAAAKNSLSLQGAGLALAWTGPGSTSIKAVWSHRLGNNPNPTASGRDQDGSLVRNRVWLTAGISL